MNDWILYEYGAYSLVEGVIEFYCNSWKPMVPKGIKIDYSQPEHIYVCSHLTKHYVMAPLKTLDITLNQLMQLDHFREMGWIGDHEYKLLAWNA